MTEILNNILLVLISVFFYKENLRPTHLTEFFLLITNIIVTVYFVHQNKGILLTKFFTLVTTTLRQKLLLDSEREKKKSLKCHRKCQSWNANDF